MATSYDCMTISRTADSRSRARGLVLPSLGAAVVIWALFGLDPDAWPGLPGAVVMTVLLVVNLAVTALLPTVKVRVVRQVQRRLVNPLVKQLYRLGINPLGIVLLQTTGRRSGRARTTPVGAGRAGDELWIVAEHGAQAQYVRNLQHNPQVRVRLRDGWRHRWVEAMATVRPDDDPWARQRWIVGWNPIRALNAASVRLLGTDVVSVRIRLLPAEVHTPGRQLVRREGSCDEAG